MGKKRRLNISHFLKGGFRGKKEFRLKVNLNRLEKQSDLTDLQHDIVKDLLNRCAIDKTIKVKDKEGKEKDKNIFKGPIYYRWNNHKVIHFPI